MPIPPKKTSQLLIQRGTNWHVRIDIPADVRAGFGNHRILSKSLKTGDKILAKGLAALQIGQWKAEFRAVRDLKLSQAEEWRGKVVEGAIEQASIKTNVIMSAVNETPPKGVKHLIGLPNAVLAERIIDHIRALETGGAHGLAEKTIKLMSSKKLSPVEFLNESFKNLMEAHVNITAKEYRLAGCHGAETFVALRNR